jgi:hypothetical protein
MDPVLRCFAATQLLLPALVLPLAWYLVTAVPYLVHLVALAPFVERYIGRVYLSTT